MEISDLQKPYKLPDALHKYIYNFLILPPTFNNKLLPQGDDKIAFFTAGQPGSGKTTLKNTIYQKFDERNIIDINTDDLRNFHPNYIDLQKDPLDLKRAAWFVNPDSVLWASKLSRESINKGFNVLYDMTFAGNVETYKNMMLFNKERGYRNELHILAVHPDISRLGCHLRYENQLGSKGYGRAVSLTSHDTNYNNLKGNIEAAINSGLVDKVSVYSRKIYIDQSSGTIKNNALNTIYETDRLPKDTKNILSVISQEQTRPFSLLEKQYLFNRFNETKDKIQRRGGDLNEFVHNLKNISTNPLEENTIKKSSSKNRKL